MKSQAHLRLAENATFGYTEDGRATMTMRTLAEMAFVPVWVNPDHMAASAIYLMDGHGIRVLAVMEGRELVGAVTRSALEALDPFVPVANAMVPIRLTLQVTTPTLEAVRLFIEQDIEFAAVKNQDRFVGMLVPSMLLKDLRLSWDPVTNLYWSDRLREWGMEQLRAGHEISLVFIDIDRFGEYNKAHGHVIGDKVLARLAELLRQNIDPDRDIVVRYGGDEFVVGSIRSFEEALEFAEALQAQSDELRLEEIPHETVTFTFGISGGRRTRDRENVHYGAMLSSLINAASLECMQKKQRTQLGPGRIYGVVPVPEETESEAPRPTPPHTV